MRFLIVLSVFLTMLSCENNSKKGIRKDELRIDIKADLIRTYDSTFRDNLIHRTFDIELSIKNKSSNPISFLLMTCSVEDNFIINNDYIEFVGKTCSSNHETVKRLNHNESLTFQVKVRRNESTLGQSVQQTKFGFVYFEPFKLKFNDVYQIFSDKSLYDQIFWSNPLKLKDE